LCDGLPGIGGLAALLLVSSSAALSASPSGHYIFAWAGDPAGQGEDFIAVIDGDPASPDYGHLVATGSSGIKTQQMHHTEYWMPEGGLLFANDHAAGRTVVMDLRDPLHPKAGAGFGDLGGFGHPHSSLRLPNGHVLASVRAHFTSRAAWLSWASNLEQQCGVVRLRTVTPCAGRARVPERKRACSSS
jgi:hypothetical protein